MPQSKRFLLRLDPRLFEALRRWADDDLRSINAQIEYLLTHDVRRAGRLPKRTPRPPTDDGPGGPDGPDGPDGPNGRDGSDGDGPDEPVDPEPEPERAGGGAGRPA